MKALVTNGAPRAASDARDCPYLLIALEAYCIFPDVAQPLEGRMIPSALAELA